MPKRAVLISIQPKWCELIAKGDKTVEIRKSRPALETPFKCYIYCTKNKHGFSVEKDRDPTWLFGTPYDYGKVIGEFVCDEIVHLDIDSVDAGAWNGNEFYYLDEMGWKPALTRLEIIGYCGIKRPYGWHISALKIYSATRKLTDFRKPELPLGLRYKDDTIKRPPQSWCYVEELKED